MPIVILPHPHHKPRILNPSEKAAENQSQSSADRLTARRFYFAELAVPLVYIFVSSHVLANVANAAPSQATVEIHHAALSSLPQPLRLPPRVSIASFPGVQQFHLDRNVPQYTPMIGSYGPVQQAWRR